MSAIMCGIGFLGCVICIIWLIARIAKRDTKKPAGIGLLLCFVLFIVGGMTGNAEDSDAGMPTNMGNEDRVSATSVSTLNPAQDDEDDKPATSVTAGNQIELLDDESDHI